MIFRLQPAQPFCFPLGCTDNIGTPATQPDSGVTRCSDNLNRFPALGAVLGAAVKSVSKFCCCSHCKELMLQEGGGQRNFICCRIAGRNVTPAGARDFSPKVGLTQSNALLIIIMYQHFAAEPTHSNSNVCFSFISSALASLIAHDRSEGPSVCIPALSHPTPCLDVAAGKGEVWVQSWGMSLILLLRNPHWRHRFNQHKADERGRGGWAGSITSCMLLPKVPVASWMSQKVTA